MNKNEMIAALRANGGAEAASDMLSADAKLNEWMVKQAGREVKFYILLADAAPKGSATAETILGWLGSSYPRFAGKSLEVFAVAVSQGRKILKACGTVDAALDFACEHGGLGACVRALKPAVVAPVGAAVEGDGGVVGEAEKAAKEALADYDRCIKYMGKLTPSQLADVQVVLSGLLSTTKVLVAA